MKDIEPWTYYLMVYIYIFISQLTVFFCLIKKMSFKRLNDALVTGIQQHQSNLIHPLLIHHRNDLLFPLVKYPPFDGK